MILDPLKITLAIQSSTELHNSLFYSGHLSDCVVKCKAREWKVHKFILCDQSPFFKGALEGNFKV